MRLRQRKSMWNEGAYFQGLSWLIQPGIRGACGMRCEEISERQTSHKRKARSVYCMEEATINEKVEACQMFTRMGQGMQCGMEPYTK